MPRSAIFIDQLNEMLSAAKYASASALPDLDAATTLSGAASSLGLLEGAAPDLASHLDSWPAALQQAILGVIRTAIGSGLSANFVWFPAPDFEVTIAQPARQGVEMISVILRGPYPSDK